MFTKTHANGVTSTDGFSVEIATMNELRYVEGDHVLTVPVELLTGDCDFVVHISHVNAWTEPSQSSLLDKAKLKTIRNRIEDALQFLGIKIRYA